MDDIVSLCHTTDLPKLHQFKQALIEQYELKDLGELSWFLGIRTIRDCSQRKLSLCQDSYVDKIIKKFHLEYAKPAHIPIQTEEPVPYEGTATPQDIYAYQQKVGSLQYATTITRPDLARTTSKLSEFLQNPYHNAVKRLTKLSHTYRKRGPWPLNTRQKRIANRFSYVPAMQRLQTTRPREEALRDTYSSCLAE